MAGSGINAEFMSIGSTAFDVTKLVVQQGQKVRISVPSIDDPTLQWFSNNDQVLSIEQSGNSGIVSCDNLGESLILFMNEGFDQLKKLPITVISEQAAKLNLSVGEPELK